MKNNKYEIDMCNGSIMDKLISFALPLMLSGILQLMFNAVDIVVVGRFSGSQSLAAVGSTTALINVFTNLFIGISLGTNVLAARFYGAGKTKEMSETVHTSIALALVSGVAMAVIGLIFSRWSLEVMGTPEDVIAQATLYMQIYFLGMPFFMVYNYGAAILRAVGDTKRPLFYLIISGVINAVLNMILVIFFHMTVVYFNVERLGQPEELIPLIKPYYLVLLASLVFVMLFNGFKQFTDGITDTKTAMWILLGGNALNIVGNYILINGKLGFPELGLLGAGISTLFSRIAMVAVFAMIVLRSRRFLRYRVGFLRMGWSFPVFRQLNALGWPVGLQMGMETASFSLSAIMVGWLGTIALASHQIMLTISQFTFMMYYGMGAAVAVRVSNFKGQGDMENVRRSTYAGFHLIMAMEIILLSIVFVLRGQMGGWFTDSVEASALVASLFFPFLIYQFGDGLQINFANALRGISDVKPMMIIAFISYFIISLPVGYFCGFVLGWGLVGVWMAFPFGLTSAGLMLWLRFRYKTAR